MITPKQPNDKQKCRLCGCTWSTPCYDPETVGCWWVEPDLCSACATPEQKAAAEQKIIARYTKVPKKKKATKPIKSELHLLLQGPSKETLKKDLRNIGDSIQSLSIFNDSLRKNF